MDDEEVRCDASGLAADLATVDALARLHLTVRHCGCRLHVHGVSRELQQLIVLVGLEDVFAGTTSAPRMGGQSEERK